MKNSFRHAAVAAFAATLAGAGSAASAAVVHINSCGDLTKSGSYVLSKNVSSTNQFGCFTISANDVVLDLNGHSVTGLAQFGSGVLVMPDPQNEPRTGVRIKNGILGNFHRGIDGKAAAGMIVENVQANVNGAEGMIAGIGSVILNARADQNGGSGIVVSGGSYVARGVFGSNHFSGVEAGAGSRIVDTSAGLNGGNGIQAIAKNSTVLARNSAEGNQVNGLLADCPASMTGNKPAQFFPNAFNDFMARQTDVAVPAGFRSIPCSSLEPGTKLTVSRVDDFPLH